MAFEPIVFTYTPPLTVSAPIADVVARPTVSNTTSNAATLIKRFNDLAETAQYLVSAIQSITRSMGISINVPANPAFDQAFKSINGLNGSQVTPTVIPIKLYSQWLNAQVAITQVEMANGLASGVDVNLAQVADLSTLTNTVEDALLENSTYQSQVPLALRGLVNDSMMFQSFQTSLSGYPVISNANGNDVGDDLNDTLNNIADRYTSNYQDLNSMLSSAGPVASDVTSVATALSAQPVQDIVQLVSLLNAARGLMYRGAFKDLAKDLANFSVVRLCCDIGSMSCMADRFTQSVLKPMTNITGPLGQVISNSKNISASVGIIPSGPLTGMPSVNTFTNGGVTTPSASAAISSVPGVVNNYPASLMALGEQASFAMAGVGSQLTNKMKQFKRATDRRISIQASLTQMMSSVQSLDSVISISGSLMPKATLPGSPVPAITSSAPVLPTMSSTVSSILTVV